MARLARLPAEVIELAQKKSSDFEASFQAKAAQATSTSSAKDPMWTKALKFGQFRIQHNPSPFPSLAFPCPTSLLSARAPVPRNSLLPPAPAPSTHTPP